MVKQWVQPPINKNKLPPGSFLLGSHLTSSIFIYYSKEVYKSNFRQYGQMKSRDWRSQAKEEKKKEDHKRESLRRKKVQVREKVGKSQNAVFFQ